MSQSRTFRTFLITALISFFLVTPALAAKVTLECQTSDTVAVAEVYSRYAVDFLSCWSRGDKDSIDNLSGNVSVVISVNKPSPTSTYATCEGGIKSYSAPGNSTVYCKNQKDRSRAKVSLSR